MSLSRVYIIKSGQRHFLYPVSNTFLITSVKEVYSTLLSNIDVISSTTDLGNLMTIWYSSFVCQKIHQYHQKIHYCKMNDMELFHSFLIVMCKHSLFSPFLVFILENRGYVSSV